MTEPRPGLGVGTCAWNTTWTRDLNEQGRGRGEAAAHREVAAVVVRSKETVLARRSQAHGDGKDRELHLGQKRATVPSELGNAKQRSNKMGERGKRGTISPGS
jgi:hypothetical protein